jgi:hypothetical protein
VLITRSFARGIGPFTTLALLLLPVSPVRTQSRTPTGAAPASSPITIFVHEPAPTERTAVAEASIEITGGTLAGQTFSSNGEGRTILPPLAPPFSLAVHKPGYESTRVNVTEVRPDGQLDVTLSPEIRDIRVKRGGSNSCNDLPAPPEGLSGLREYARVPVHHDGVLTVTSAQLPFFSNPGFVYRETANGWIKNEVDYVLLRSPIPVQGGFVYLITFGGDREQCGPWSIDFVHPS